MSNIKEHLKETLKLKKEHYETHSKRNPKAWFLKQDLANIKRSEKTLKGMK